MKHEMKMLDLSRREHDLFGVYLAELTTDEANAVVEEATRTAEYENYSLATFDEQWAVRSGGATPPREYNLRRRQAAEELRARLARIVAKLPREESEGPYTGALEVKVDGEDA